MNKNKAHWMIPFFISILLTLACGQFSVGMITPTVETLPDETTTALLIEATEAPSQSQPDSSPTSGPDPTETIPVMEAGIPTLAYIGQDGNLWVRPGGSETPRQLTFDAKPIGGEDPAIEYGFPRLSSDGTLLAYRMDVGVPSGGGYDYTSGLWVVDLASNDQRQILDVRPAGMDWKPGTHLLAYCTSVETEYFLNRGQPDPALATGIRAVDLDSGESRELVAPERGYALHNPRWSPDGRFLAFDEVFSMEGSGFFGYYDFENQEYVAWEEPVGATSWSPDGELLSYARHTYAATGEERLYIRQRLGSEQPLGPDYNGPAYATHPVFSPGGDQIAYLAFLDGPETQTATIMLLTLSNGVAAPLGEFSGLWELAWTPDGRTLVFSAGHWETPQVIALAVLDGSQTVLAAGSQPTLAGP